MSNPFAPGSRLFETAETLLVRDHYPLVPKGAWSAEITTALWEAESENEATPNAIAALHLLNDDPERAHLPAQRHEGKQTADYLHMLVHRREGDWSNAGYWARRTGAHPVFAELFAALIGDKTSSALKPLTEWRHWEPQVLVDLCRKADQGMLNAEAAEAVTALSAQETVLTLTWCVRNHA